MTRGMKPGDPRAVVLGRRGQAASRITRRQQMWDRFQALSAVQVSAFDAFCLGWEAHRKWSAVRRWQQKRARTGEKP